MLALTVANNTEHIFRNKRIVQTFKIKAFKSYIQSIFFYFDIDKMRFKEGKKKDQPHK